MKEGQRNRIRETASGQGPSVLAERPIRPAAQARVEVALVLLGLTFLILLLYGRALVTPDVLSQSDLLWIYAPWKAHEPADFQRPSNPVLSDQSLQVIPNLTLIRSSLREGRLPLWNPSIMCGMPFLASMQPALFFPLTWLVAFFPVVESLEWICTLKLLIGGLGFYLFCRRALRLAAVASFGGTVIFMLCGFNTVWLFYPVTNVSLLLGWLLLVINCIIRRAAWRPVLAGAILGALSVFGGHPETLLHLLLVCLIYAAFCLAKQKKGAAGASLRLASSALLGAGISAVQWLPFLESAYPSATLLQRRLLEQFGIVPHLKWYLGIVALVPDFLGNPSVGFMRGPSNYNEMAAFSSVSALFLAAIALARKRSSTAVRFGVTVSVFSACVVYGIPPFFQLFHLIPFYRHVNNTRLLLGLCTGLSILAAAGLDQLPEIKQRRTWKKLLLWTLAPASFLTASLLWAFRVLLQRPGFLPDQVSYLKLQIVCYLGTLGVIVLLLLLSFHRAENPRTRYLGPKALAFGWLLLICLEMVHFAWGYNPTIPRNRDAYRVQPQWLKIVQNAAQYRIVGVQPGTLVSNTGMVYGLRDFRGYDFPEPMPYHLYFHRLIDTTTDFNYDHHLPQLTPHLLRTLGNASVRFFLSETPMEFPALHLVSSGDALLYEYRGAVPRAFIPQRVQFVRSNQEALSRINNKATDARQLTLLTGGGANLPPLDADAASRVRLRVDSDGPEHVHVSVFTPQPAFLVLNDQQLPGWRALVDGRPARTFTANGMFRAVAVPALSSSVEFRYAPSSFKVAKWISILSLLLLSIATFGLFIRKLFE